MSKLADELEIQIRHIEREYKIVRIALIWGWLPFAMLGAGVLHLAPSLDSALYYEREWVEPGASFVFLVLGLFVVLMVGFIAFYAIVFNRAAKIRAELSEKRVKLNVDIKGELPRWED